MCVYFAQRIRFQTCSAAMRAPTAGEKRLTGLPAFSLGPPEDDLVQPETVQVYLAKGPSSLCGWRLIEMNRPLYNRGTAGAVESRVCTRLQETRLCIL